MNKSLLTLFKKEEFTKINEILENGFIKTGMMQREVPLTKNDLQEIKVFSEDKIRQLLYNNGSIPTNLIKIINFFGNDFMTSFQSIIISYVVPRATADLSIYLNANFKDLLDLTKVYEFLEKRIENINFKYGNLPKSWSMDLQFLTRAIVMIKQKICDYFFITESDERSYSSGFGATIEFEQRIKSFLIANKCCNCKINFLDDNGSTNIVSLGSEDILCVHRKMLSSIFIPNINLYYKHYLNPYLLQRYNQGIVEMNIIEMFTIFFREVQFIYERINYFDDISLIKEFCIYFDYYLEELIKKIFAEKDIKKSCIVLNTVIFISQILDDISTSISERYAISMEFKSNLALSKLEKDQNSLIDKYISENIIKFTKEYGNSEKFINFINLNIPQQNEFPDEVTNNILEVIMGNILGQISSMRLNKNICENLISDICEIETYLLSRYSKIPYMKMIKNYLKIFACSTESKEEFVNNFLTLSNNTFTFHQILNALENQSDAGELFIAYKRFINK